MVTFARCTCLWLLICAGRADDRPVAPLSEAQKIEQLIASVESLEGAVFIRNGSEHTPREAGAHLRRKLRSAGSRIQTAQQFVDLIGSKSSSSGEPYRMRLADGTTITLRARLLEQLGKLEPAR